MAFAKGFAGVCAAIVVNGVVPEGVLSVVLGGPMYNIHGCRRVRQEGQGEARRGEARQGEARRGKARQGEAMGEAMEGGRVTVPFRGLGFGLGLGLGFGLGLWFAGRCRCR